MRWLLYGAQKPIVTSMTVPKTIPEIVHELPRRVFMSIKKTETRVGHHTFGTVVSTSPVAKLRVLDVEEHHDVTLVIVEPEPGPGNPAAYKCG